MSDKTLAQRALEQARAAGASDADVIIVRATDLHVGVSGGALEETTRAESFDIGLRVLLGQRQACVAGANADADALAEMARRAVAFARAAPEDPWVGLAAGDQIGAYSDPDGLDMVDQAPPPDARVLEEWALQAEAAGLAVPGVSMIEQASARTSTTRITLAASNGFSGQYGRTSFGIGVSAVAGRGLGRENDHAHESRAHQADLPDPQEIGRLAGSRAVERLEPRRPPGGKVPVLYDRRVSASLISHLLGAINGVAVARGASWLADAMGKAVLPLGIDLDEDPLIARGPLSRPFDAEGLACRKRRLIADGVLQSWLLDCASARQLGLQSTANARRGTSAPPSPGASNIRMTPGTHTHADLIAAMGSGLLVTSMIGASINPTTGDYSRGAAGFWVENGAIAYPVSGVTIAGSLAPMLRSITPANDAEPHRALAVPSLLVEGLTVGV